ncbi:MAG: IS5/IS1182 family transposase, partial [Rhodospirillales bacterium]|nr:IS5/IS1182 family transposase [Rhodospirillales bacterium]
GHLKSGHRMKRNYLAHEQGDAINPILAATGYNFRLILKWIRLLLRQIWMMMICNQSARIA